MTATVPGTKKQANPVTDGEKKTASKKPAATRLLRAPAKADVAKKPPAIQATSSSKATAKSASAKSAPAKVSAKATSTKVIAAKAPIAKAPASKAAATKVHAARATLEKTVPAKVSPAKAVASEKAATKAPSKAAGKPPVKSSPAKSSPAKASAAKTPAAKTPAAKSSPAKSSAAKTPAAKTSPAKTDAKATPAKTTATKASKPTASAKSAAATPKESPAPSAGNGPGVLPKRHKTVERRTEGYSDERWLTHQRHLLDSERATYVEQARLLKAEAESLVEEMEPGDIQFDDESGEGGTVTVDRERDLALSAQALQTVDEIDHSLAKMAGKTYGICENCGKLIPKPRLEALPFARLCIDCKSGGLSRR